MDIEYVADRVFRILNGYRGLGGTDSPVKAYDEVGTAVIDPEKARSFYIDDPNIMVQIDDDGIRVSKSKFLKKEKIEAMLSRIRTLAVDENQINYTLKNFDGNITPKKFSLQAKRNKEQKVDNDMNIAESRLGKLHGFTKTSYQRLGEVKLIYRHSKPVNEEVPMTRARNIKKISLEHNGDTFDFPNNFVLGARALARHIHEGGAFDDTVSTYIIEMSRRCKKMNEFLQYSNRNRNLIEGNEEAVQLVKENLAQLKYDFKKFTAPTTYQSFREKFENANIAVDENVGNLKDQFTVRQFDSKLESVLPYINSLLQEKNAYEKSIMEQLSGDSIFKSVPHYSKVLEFDSKHAKLAYKIKETAAALESESLSTFLSRISEKIAAHQILDEFEVKVVREIFNKAQNNAFTLEE